MFSCHVCCRTNLPRSCRIKNHVHLGEFCSADCAKQLWIGVSEDGSMDDDRTYDELLDELRGVLATSIGQCRAHHLSDPELAQKIRNDLNILGVSHVFVDNPEQNVQIKRNTGQLLLNTLHVTQPAIVNEVRTAGRFDSFCKYWQKNTFATHKIWGKSIGMPYPPLLRASERTPFTFDGNVFVKNALTAKNSPRTWETLIQHYPQLHPDQWLPKGDNDRVNVSEDGMKVTCGKKYTPTALHYDGQFAADDAQDIETRRVQILYSDDSGPMRLFVVPRSATYQVRYLIRRLTGIRIKDKFDAWGTYLKQNHARVYHLLHQYSVALKGPGLQFFTTAVWHFEAAEDPQHMIRANLVAPNLTAQGRYDYDASKEATERGSSFRLYCGIVALPFQPSLIRFAYFREHGWSMDPWAKDNKDNRRNVFVNDKSNSSPVVQVDYAENRAAFRQLKETPLDEMKAYLRNLTPLRLYLYGLKMTDLN